MNQGMIRLPQELRQPFFRNGTLGITRWGELVGDSGWRKRKKPYISARTVVMNQESGWASVRDAGSGIRLWKKWFP